MAFNFTLRKTFLYIFATVGLVLCIIGTVSLINLGLRSYVFTKSDYPCYKPYPAEFAVTKDPAQPNLSEAEKDRLNKESEKQCEEQRVSDKQRQASQAISMLLVGIPLYLYHWYVIRKENQV